MITIINIEDPLIQCFRSLRDATLKKNNQIIAESEKVVLKLLNTDIKIITLFATEDFLSNHKLIINTRCKNILTAPRSLMQEIVGHSLHHGVMALAARPSNLPLSELTYPCVVLNGVVSAENVGAIIRNCAAFGFKSLLVDSISCSPFIRRAIRVSMGNIFKMNVRETASLLEELKELSSNQVSVISTANIDSAKNINSFKVTDQKFAVIIGSEGYGIDASVLSASDHIVKIPIDDETAAINAACASAIFLYKLQVE